MRRCKSHHLPAGESGLSAVRRGRYVASEEVFCRPPPPTSLSTTRYQATGHTKVGQQLTPTLLVGGATSVYEAIKPSG